MFRLIVNGQPCGNFETMQELSNYIARNNIDDGINSIQIERISEYR